MAAREVDHCSPAGATALARRIRAYWAERGHAVDVRVEIPTHIDHGRNALCAVRSNLVNGAPEPPQQVERQAGTDLSHAGEHR